MKKLKQSAKVGKPITFTDDMLDHDLKQFLKTHSIDQANPSSLGKFSCTKENLAKKLTNGIARHVWMNRYKNKLKSIKAPTALVINHPDGQVDIWPSPYDIVYNLSKVEQLAATHRLINIAMDLSQDAKIMEEQKTKIKKLQDDNRRFRIDILELMEDNKLLRIKVREESLDSLNPTRRKQKKLDNVLDMRKKLVAEKGCSGDFKSNWPEIFSAIQDDSVDKAE